MQPQTKIFLSIFLAAIFFSQKVSYARESGDTVSAISPNLSLNYVSTSNDSVTLTANIYVRRESGSFSLENADIEFSLSNGMETRNLGKVKTGYDGNAMIRIASDAGLLRDKEGKTTYTASFSGKGDYEPAQESVTFKTAMIQISFTKEDTIHNILVKAFQTETNHERKPLPNETVNIYIPRMLSDLKIGEVTLDENGEGKLEFTGGIVGDSLGNLVFIGRIEENENYGTVQGRATTSWGIPKQYFLAERPSRELWTPIAPLWMIVTLIIMLAGVWGHYLFAIIQLVGIKKVGKSKKEYL